MFSFKSHVAAKAVEEAAQHEADRFWLPDHAAMPDVQQDAGQISREACIRNMFAAQPVCRQSSTAPRDRLLVSGKDHGLLIVMRQPQRRQKCCRDLQACHVIDIGGKTVGDGFEFRADRDLPVVDPHHRFGHAEPPQRLARQAAGFTWP
ncbi:hypothetical protein ASG68_15690 [Rhizobium sp. Leaf453]|nr:hypothetical protein ASG50_12130 [Rhizobium sp. Leaf386]KQS88972.1 hypothetical protein ASG42_14500 [Rhizobium sp. Leaf391]KQT92820.1 hypothetical protein ASG68_15690 [Rhizobium sp. Leaf453]